MRIASFLFFLMCLLSCSSFNKSSNKSLLSKNKQKASDYNREYYQKNREKLKLRARERYRRNKKT
ncbi:hypothetical protein QIA17_00355 (plasmid) [Borreliella californiensis]|uniref:Lipoprotein n=1 Tax=Borreliella californiensis TaxID=373543 RepID=A0A7W9ZKU4_9SPIR|nr:hypothetical protein [Borreliella californiensis]MBB6213385.1 hypothetical protein [Borreliella californiensis]MBB6213456.1 hypothetical protein [Borreliella californiensis]WKC91291.1 hypothetical protein QIA17_00355 [Borreliella californiensis]WNY70950.1 hypothetical protein QIA39_04600 [Borreliella californiensis]